MSDPIQFSPFTGRPLPKSSAIAAARIASAPVALHGARVAPPAEPQGLARVLRPQARWNWILPQLSAITPTYIESVLRGAFTGSHVAQWQLFDLMEDTWPRLMKNLNEVKRAVISLDWKLQPWMEEDEAPTDSAKERMRLISSALWRMQPDPAGDENGFQQTLYDLLDAWAKGTSILEILWHIRRAGSLGDITAPRAAVWVRPDNYAWSTDNVVGLNPNALNSDNGPVRPRAYLATPAYWELPEQVIPFPPDKFIVAINKGKTGHPLTSALMRPLAWWWCASNFSADWLMNLAQVFGLPFRWANYADGASQSTVDSVCAMLENMGSAGWGAFPEGTTLDLKEASKTGDASPQADLLDRADKQADLLILGQSGTTEVAGPGKSGGSMAANMVLQRTKEEVIRAAACFAAEVINRQLIPAILRQNYGDDEEPPEFKPEPSEQKDAKANADRDVTLIQAGVQMPKEWFYKRHDIPLPQDSEEVIGQMPGLENPAPNSAEQGSSGARSDLQAKHVRDAAPPELRSVDVDRLAAAFAQDLKPIRDRIERILTIDDPEILRQKLEALNASLPQLLKNINADPESARVMEDALRRSLLDGALTKSK